MVLVVHGGPWARDIFAYRRHHQWLPDRGYAVLSVNYRGSASFGKAFVTATEREHARKMHSDLIDMVEWAIFEGIVYDRYGYLREKLDAPTNLDASVERILRTIDS
jgi:dipeptidyl aminopeptidase/acylaminoacyl peptidase